MLKQSHDFTLYPWIYVNWQVVEHSAAQLHQLGVERWEKSKLSRLKAFKCFYLSWCRKRLFNLNSWWNFTCIVWMLTTKVKFKCYLIKLLSNYRFCVKQGHLYNRSHQTFFMKDCNILWPPAFSLCCLFPAYVFLFIQQYHNCMDCIRGAHMFMALYLHPFQGHTLFECTNPFSENSLNT